MNLIEKYNDQIERNWELKEHNESGRLRSLIVERSVSFTNKNSSEN